MDVLSVGGKDYVKASVIARDLGYTADYVGQLCRSNKVDAKLVGRSWYVDRNSIHSHRSTRYRSTQAKSLESLKETLEVVHAEEESVHVPIHTTTDATNRKVKTPAYISYSEDPADLIPTVGKSSYIPVSLADAKEVSVNNSDASYVFETPSLPVIKFKGKLKLSSFEEQTALENDTKKRIIHPTWVFGKNDNKANKLGISSVSMRKLTRQKKTTAIHHAKLVPKTATSMMHLAVVDALPKPVTAVKITENNVSPVSKLFLFATTAASFCFVFLIFGTESRVLASGGSVATSYAFTFENIFTSLHATADSLQSALYLVEFSTNFLFL